MMPLTAGCCLIVLPTEPLDHALDRDLPGEPAYRVETRVTPHAQIHAVLLLKVAASVSPRFRRSWPDPSLRDRQPRIEGSSLLEQCFGIRLLPSPLHKVSDYLMRPHEGQANVCPVARTL